MLTRMWLFAGKEWTEKIKCGKRKHIHSWFHFAVDCKSDKILLLWKFK